MATTAYGVLPTGGGKSICYQVPALIFSGVTIVISPLISLMKDQVESLNKIGISSTYLNSSLTPFQTTQILTDILNQKFKIIYISPERLCSPKFQTFLHKISISMFAIDEAHCVSQWGHDFRTSYLKIADIIAALPYRPILTAFTATATPMVKKDIINLLRLKNPFVLTNSFDRPNLNFNVFKIEDKIKFIMNYIKSHSNESGIVYCAKRKSVEILYEKLKSINCSVSKYHGGLCQDERIQNQENFINNITNIMIATNAFGMGINKQNVRFVIHYNMPKDLESYYQEAGRAGRDGNEAVCYLLFSKNDIRTNEFFIKKSSQRKTAGFKVSKKIPKANSEKIKLSKILYENSTEKFKFPQVLYRNSTEKISYRKLSQIINYCNTEKCLRRYLLNYFGESPTFRKCYNCSNCDDSPPNIFNILFETIYKILKQFFQ